ncbi:MAG: cytochrome o ubiquinol oxidase subunit IV [Porphyromonadaceae bacterium]|nr:cytochrome o ubiquinol oxidase subunit IV [Porphyromonadaceae bacterium]
MNHSHQENENMGAGNITKRNYLIGFILATVLTIISFGFVVFKDSLPRNTIVILLSAAALLQMFVHLYYFLHLNKSSEQRWNLIAFLFTLVLMFIFIGGTIWVMYTLNIRMM